MNLNNQLRAIRESSGLNQSELADRAGVTQGAVSQWENGRTAISLPVLSRVLDVCSGTKATKKRLILLWVTEHMPTD